MEEAQDHVLRVVEDRAVRVIQLWFTDVLGIPRSFDITPAELERALAEGITFDGSA
ncbi:MAG: glutamine synthetase, partial [Actinobacteria bacterium]|nr:glutamine synthetase [Actinomycetota bacterium]